jgi:dihydrofolate reductase
MEQFYSGIRHLEKGRKDRMRKIIVTEFLSLDGVMEDPGGAEKFKYGGWTWPYWNDEIGKFKNDELFACEALLLGRKTYQGFAAAWPGRTDKEGFADRMNSLPKYIVSTTLKEVEWNNSRLIKENVGEKIYKLKQQPGKDILIAGSGQLVNALIQENLIDQFNLLVYPVILGSGKRLFREESKTNLKLLETKSFGSGVVLLVYQTEKI